MEACKKEKKKLRSLPSSTPHEPVWNVHKQWDIMKSGEIFELLTCPRAETAGYLFLLSSIWAADLLYTHNC